MMYTCRSYGSANIIKNGTSNYNIIARIVAVYRVLEPKQHHSDKTQASVESSPRKGQLAEIERIFNVCRQTVAKWMREYVKQLPFVADTLLLSVSDSGCPVNAGFLKYLFVWSQFIA